MGKSSPEAPKAPDYAAANREGIYADIETLPIRRLIENASMAGRNIQYQTPAQKAAYDAAVKAGTPTNLADYQTSANFEGYGDIDKARELARMANETADLSAQSQLDVGRKYNEGFQNLAIEALKRQDPEGYAGRQELAQGLRREYSDTELPSESQTSQQLRDAATLRSLLGVGGQAQSSPLDALIRQAGISQAGSGGDEFGFAGSSGTQEARNAAIQRGLSDFALGSSLSGEQARQVEQSVRGAAAARGQSLSSSGAVQEALGKFQLGEQMRQQRLGNLMNIGAQAFGQEQATAAGKASTAQQRLMNLFNAQGTEFGQQQASLGQRQQQDQLNLANVFQSQGVQFGQEQAMRQEQQQQQQRRLSNLQQYTLGAPISSQFQSLQGAQQGSSPYAPIMAQGIGQNANAGAQATGFASNIFGTQANIYGTEMANSGSPLAGIAGSVLGAAAGGMFGAGGKFGQTLPVKAN